MLRHPPTSQHLTRAVSCPTSLARAVRRGALPVCCKEPCSRSADSNPPYQADSQIQLRPAQRLSLLIASLSASALPCQAIVEEKLTGSPAYKPTPTEVGWEVIVGAVVATIPLIVASYEFGKRILIQRRCPACKGSGLIARGRFLRKCSNCGGFLPWQGWKTFFLSTAAPGNGGPLRQPRGQTGIFYKVPPRQLEEERKQRMKESSPSTQEDSKPASDNT